jgi:hypothetical protein
MVGHNLTKPTLLTNTIGILEPGNSFHDPIAKTSVSQGAPSTSLSNTSDFEDRILDVEVEL